MNRFLFRYRQDSRPGYYTIYIKKELSTLCYHMILTTRPIWLSSYIILWVIVFIFFGFDFIGIVVTTTANLLSRLNFAIGAKVRREPQSKAALPRNLRPQSTPESQAGLSIQATKSSSSTIVKLRTPRRERVQHLHHEQLRAGTSFSRM